MPSSANPNTYGVLCDQIDKQSGVAAYFDSIDDSNSAQQFRDNIQRCLTNPEPPTPTVVSVPARDSLLPPAPPITFTDCYSTGGLGAFSNGPAVRAFAGPEVHCSTW